MAGMALGYGLGRFPRPHFHFHNPQEEYYYNHYMYRKYGSQSTDTNDYSRYRYSQPPETYDRYMDSCMKRSDLLPAENRKPNNKPAATPTSATTTTATTTTAVTSAPDSGTGSNATEANSTAAKNPSTSALPSPLNRPEANPAPAASQALRKAPTNDDDDDDTVSVVEIGYPALIEQLKARRCLELYMVYSEKYMKTLNGGVVEVGSRGLLAVVTSTVLMLLNSNMLMLLH